MTCTACGCKDIEEGEHRCPRCGRRFDQPAPSERLLAPAPAPPPPVISSGPGLRAAAVAPQWRQELAGRLAAFQHKRSRQQNLFSEAPEEGQADAVPRPDSRQKVVAFEDFAPSRIEPLIVPPKLPPLSVPRPPARRPEPPAPPAPATRKEPEPPAPCEPAEELFPREILCPCPVAPLQLRGISGALDLAVAIVGVGVFWGVFHLLGGALHFHHKGAGAIALASAAVVAFYFSFYTLYGLETPGLQWTGLRVLDYAGYRPRAGQRLLRSLGLVLSAAALGLGYFWALVDEEGLTWHDRMSKTFVTRDPGAPRRFRA
jgi:uncharacterized RDD family membrane protein YckC